MILVASVARLEFGFALGFPNALATGLSTDNSTIFNHQLHFTPIEMDLVGSLLFSGLMVSTLPTGWLAGSFGRRFSMVVSCLPTTLGWLLITFAHNNLMIFTGRFICGFGVLMLSNTTKIYVAEITNNSFRGMASTFLETMKYVGIVVVAAAATSIQWYMIAGINAVVMVMLGGAMLALPESPAFLAIKNRKREARKALRLIKGPKADVDAELELLTLRNEQKGGNSGYAALFNQGMLKQVAALFMLLALRDFCGSDVVMVHTTRMLQDTGVTIDHGLSTLIVTAVSLCGVLFLSVVVDRLGRRWSMMGSFTVMAVGYVIMGFHSHLMPPPAIQPDSEMRLVSPPDDNATASYMAEASDNGEDGESRLFPFYCLLGIAFANAAGVDNVPLLVVVEYFPSSVRPQGLSLCTIWMSSLSMVATQLYSTTVDGITLAGLFWTYALFAVAGTVCTVFFIRETSKRGIA